MRESGWIDPDRTPVVPIVFLAVLLFAAGTAGAAIASGSVDDRATIAPEVRNAEGEQVVVVHVESERVVADTGETTVEALKEQAGSGQAPLERYARRTPGVTIENSFWLGNLAVVTIDHERADVEELAAVPNVAHVGPNFEVSVDTTLSDGQARQASGPTTSTPSQTGAAVLERSGSVATPGLFHQSGSIAGLDPVVGPASSHTTYGLDQINTTEVWNTYGTKGGGITIAVLDTGVDPNHPDITLDEWGEWDRSGNRESTSPRDHGTHGTHVSGTATGANASGTHIGVAPNATLHHGAVLTSCGGFGCSGTFPQINAGMQWAVDNGVDVLSMSLGATGYYDQFIGSVRDATSAGTIVVAAAGNAGEGTSDSPGNIYDSFAVGASDKNENIWSGRGESAGETIDTDNAWGSDAPADWPEEYVVPAIVAPGSGVYSAEPGGGYGYKSGTSMATPHVSGAIALLQSATGSNLSIDQIEDALIETAWKPAGEPDGQDIRYGHGIIDARAAVDLFTGAGYLRPEVDSTNSPVAQGDTLEINATIRNLDTETATQEVTLVVNGTERDSTNVTLGSGDTTTVALHWNTVQGDSGPYTATVASENTSDSAGVTLTGATNFSVTIDATNAPVAEGDSLALDATIKNTGTENDSQTVTLSIDGTVADSNSVSLEGGQSTRKSFYWNTSDGDVGTHTATVASKNDTDSAGVTVTEPANFTVAIDATNSPVLEGDSLNVTATVINTGGSNATQTLELAVDGQSVRSIDETISPGNSSEITLQWKTGAGDSGNRTVTVSSADDTNTTTVRVAEPTVGDYTNESGVVDQLGLIEAIADWRVDIVDTLLLLDVIDAWRSGDPVPSLEAGP